MKISEEQTNKGQDEDDVALMREGKSMTFFMNPKNWWKPLLFILIVSLAGVGMIGYQTYNDAPPLTTFKSGTGQIIASQADIENGQLVFHKYALMEFGSMFGDGAQRGPDFTAEALHLVCVYMNEYYTNNFTASNTRLPSQSELNVIADQVQIELKQNGYNENGNVILLNDAQVYAFDQLKNYYTNLYTSPANTSGFPPANYITDKKELADLSSFFFWGAWVCVTERPGSEYSYTHNWPFDPDAGNNPTPATMIWSVVGLLAFVLGCGIVLYFIGQYNQLPNRFFKAPKKDLLTVEKVAKFIPTRTQRASYKFFLVAIILFLFRL